jgi:hypothetical protein
MISDACARTIAAHRYSGYGYRFASTGHIDAEGHTWRDFADAGGGWEGIALLDYLEHHGPRDPQPGWHQLWCDACNDELWHHLECDPCQYCDERDNR